MSLSSILSGGFLDGKKRIISILALSALQIFPQYKAILMPIGTLFGLWGSADAVINNK